MQINICPKIKYTAKRLFRGQCIKYLRQNNKNIFHTKKSAYYHNEYYTWTIHINGNVHSINTKLISTNYDVGRRNQTKSLLLGYILNFLACRSYIRALLNIEIWHNSVWYENEPEVHVSNAKKKIIVLKFIETFSILKQSMWTRIGGI